MRINSGSSNIRTRQTLEKIVGRAIFLDDHDYMLKHQRIRRGIIAGDHEEPIHEAEIVISRAQRSQRRCDHIVADGRSLGCRGRKGGCTDYDALRVVIHEPRYGGSKAWDRLVEWHAQVGCYNR